MSHFLIAFDGAAPDPANSGDTKSWFFYYKWHPGEDDEVFVPVDTEACECAVPGDTIWFTMDGEAVGKATLLRVAFDPFNGRKEMWFNGKSCVPVVNRAVVGAGLQTGPLDDVVVSSFESLCQGASS